MIRSLFELLLKKTPLWCHEKWRPSSALGHRAITEKPQNQAKMKAEQTTGKETRIFTMDFYIKMSTLHPIQGHAG